MSIQHLPVPAVPEHDPPLATAAVVAAFDPAAEARWRAWQARGAELDRGRTVMIFRGAVLALLAIVVWLFVRMW
jgi:hypothetical protein